MCHLRGDCRPGDLGEPGVNEDRPGAKYEKQEKVRGLIWARLFIPKNKIWSSVRFVMEKGNYLRIRGTLTFGKNVEDLDFLRKNLKSSKRWRIENK